MKHFKTLLGIALVASTAMALLSCSDDEKMTVIEGCDAEEYVTMQHIGKALGLEFTGNPLTWEGVSWSAIDSESDVMHVSGLMLIVRDGEHYIPEELGNLRYLRAIAFGGAGFHGSFPQSVADNGTLRSLQLVSTNITSIPDNIFNSNMIGVKISHNYLLDCNLPSSITQLRGDKAMNSESFVIEWNSLHGYVPALRDINIYLSYNCLEGSDPSNAFITKQVPSKVTVQDDILGVWLQGNYLHGELSQELLADTLALVHFAIMTADQRGSGFSNMPSKNELIKRSREYYTNHPELFDMTILLPGYFDPNK